jgi:hypothetical protein
LEWQIGQRAQREQISHKHNRRLFRHCAGLSLSSHSVEFKPGLAFIATFANVTVLDTPLGLVLIDSGAEIFAATIFGLVREYSKKPVHMVRLDLTLCSVSMPLFYCAALFL